MSKVEFLIDHTERSNRIGGKNCVITKVDLFYLFKILFTQFHKKSWQCLRTIVCKQIDPLVFSAHTLRTGFFARPEHQFPRWLAVCRNQSSSPLWFTAASGCQPPLSHFANFRYIYIYIVGKNKNHPQEIRNVAIKSSVIHPVGWKCGEGFSVSLTIAYYARQINRFKKAHKKSFLQKVWKIEG